LTIVLDTWGLVAYLRDESGTDRVREAWIDSGAAMCSINLGEALYMEMRVRGGSHAGTVIEEARRELIVIEPDWDLVVSAAAVKAGGGLSYADAFCIATAKRLAAPLWTGDPEIVGLGAGHGVEVVDLRVGG